MDAVGAASSIAALAELAFRVMGYIKDVHGAGKEIEDYHQEVPNVVALLYSLVARIPPNGRRDPWFESVRIMVQEQYGPMQQYHTALKTFLIKVAPGTGRLDMLAKHLKWPFIKDDVKNILAKMERLKSLVAIALEMDHFKLSEAMLNTVSEVKCDTAAIRTTAEKTHTEVAALQMTGEKTRIEVAELKHRVLSAEEAHRKADISAWLSDQDYSEQQRDNILRYKEGTALWFLSHPTYQAWENGMRDTLFCPGMPGAGKTVISALVIRHLIQTLGSPDVAVIYLYCRYDQRERQSTEHLLASLIRQLISWTSKVPEEINQVFDAHQRSDLISFSQYQQMLHSAVRSFTSIYLIVDALDEGQRVSVKNLISTIRSLPTGVIRLLATSRFIPEIQTQFDEDLCVRIRGSDADVETYATSRLIELPRCVQNNATLQAEIVEGIVKSTQGMFLLAKLNIDSLKDKRSVKTMKMTLGNLPTGQGSTDYDAAYDLAMNRIANQSQDDHSLAQKILTWVMHAMRPLSDEELEIALAVELGELTLDSDNIIPTVELLSLCAGLVILDEESRSVRLVHYTTQQYLSRNPQHLLNKPHRNLSNVCVSYLGLDDFMDADFSAKRISRQYYPFYKYAALHWEDHDETASSLDDRTDSEQATSLDLRLLHHDELMHSYMETRSARHENRIIRTGIQYAAHKGWYQRVSALLRMGHDHNEAKHGTTPMIEAARALQEPIVRLLIDANADVNIQSKDLVIGRNHTALTITPMDRVHGGDGTDHVLKRLESIVALLLAAGSDPDHIADPQTGTTTLMRATRHRLETVVAMLCRAGADVNRRNSGDRSCDPDTTHRSNTGSTTSEFASALHLAVLSDHEGIARILLEHGCDLDIMDSSNSSPAARSTTAMHLAAFRGNEEIVRLLLDYGCNPDITDSSGASPASYAATKCHWGVLAILLDTGKINVDRKIFEYDLTFLARACGEDNQRCPEALLKRLLQASPQRIDVQEWGKTPIMRAAQAENTSAVKILLEAGANVRHLPDEAPGGGPYGYMMLHFIAKLPVSTQDTTTAIMRLLFEADLDLCVDARGTNGVTPLMLAAKAGNRQGIRFLLEKGANVLLEDNDEWTALFFAAEAGHEGVVTCLLETGAYEDVDLAHAFLLAAASGHIKILRTLVNAGVNLDMFTQEGLHLLASEGVKTGRVDVVHMLIDFGARVNPQLPNLDGSPLILSVEHGFKDVTRLLLDAGALVNLSEQQGNTALVSLMKRRASCKSEADDTAILSMLLEAGADVNAVSAYGQTALLLATHGDVLCRCGQCEDEHKKWEATLSSLARQDDFSPDKFEPDEVVGESFLTRARVNTACQSGEGTFQQAARSERRNIVRLLLAAGADPSDLWPDSRGRNAPVGSSILDGNRGAGEAVRLSSDPNLDAGGGPDRRDRIDNHAMVRIFTSTTCTEDCLELHMDAETVHLCNVSCWEGIEGIRALVKAGMGIDMVDKEGNTALMHAAEHADTVKFLLDFGADPNIVNKQGETAMMRCFLGSWSHAGKIRNLLDAGACVNMLDHRGRNALIWAASTKDLYWGEPASAVKLLLVAGVNVDHVDDDENTALMCAERMANTRIADLIRKEIQRREGT